MSGVIPPPAPTKIQFVELYKKLAQEVAERLSAYGGLSKLASDTFKDSTGINSGLSSGYTYRGTPNFDVIKQTTVNTKLLLHFNSLPFTDSGPNALTFTKQGDSRADTSVKKIGTSSLKLDGTGDYINCAANNIFNIGTGNFCIEGWINASSWPANAALFSTLNAAQTAGIGVYISGSGANIRAHCNGTVIIATHSALSTGTQYHIAVVRNSGVLKIYLDGVEVGSGACTDNVTSNSGLAVGSFQGDAASAVFNGNFDEVRFSNVARYTAGFTPSTTEFSSDANTLALLHFDISATDSSTSGNNGSYVNGAYNSDVQKKFGAASLFLDGTDDYVSVPDSEDWNFGALQSTIDCWIRPSTVSIVELGIVSQGQDANNCFTLRFDAGDPTKLQFAVYSGGSNLLSMSGTHGMSVNTWYHIAVVRGWGGNVNDWALCVNGVAVATATASITMPNLTSPLYIGYDVRSSNKYFSGYIDEVRVVKNEAKWTASFTPETSEYSTPAAPTQAVIVSERLLNLTTATTLLMMFVDVTLNSGTATYYVSTDDGSTWTTVSDLTLIQAVPSGTQIRTKVVLTGDAELEFVGVAVP